MQRGKMSEGKKNIIAQLIQEYDIKSAEDIHIALKDLLGETVQNMLEGEMDEQLGYEPYERNDSENARNGYKPKARLLHKYQIKYKIFMSLTFQKVWFLI